MKNAAKFRILTLLLLSVSAFAKDKAPLCTALPHYAHSQNNGLQIYACTQENKRGLLYSTRESLAAYALITEITAEQYNMLLADEKYLTPPADSSAYAFTGKLEFRATKSDSEAHVTINGTTYDSYCSFSSSRAYCTDSPGFFFVTFQNGKTMPLTKPDLRYTTVETAIFSTLDKPQTFKYRLAVFPDYRIPAGQGPAPFFCISTGHSEEVCFPIYSDAVTAPLK